MVITTCFVIRYLNCALNIPGIVHESDRLKSVRSLGTLQFAANIFRIIFDRRPSGGFVRYSACRPLPNVFHYSFWFILLVFTWSRASRESAYSSMRQVLQKAELFTLREISPTTSPSPDLDCCGEWLIMILTSF